MEISGDGAAMTLFDAVGGADWFVELVERFYARVEADDVLRHMYPEDLSGPKAHTAAFLVQYWGGPTTYSEERGHPRLRMRHAPFVIGQRERDAWLQHMLGAVSAMGPISEVEAALSDYFTSASTHMINSDT